MPTITVKDGNGNSQTVNTLPATGANTASNALPVTIASDQTPVSVSVTSIPEVEIKNDSGNAIPVNVTSSVDVEIKNDAGNPIPSVLTTGSAVIGTVVSRTSKVAVTPTITSGSAYTSGNLVGPLLTFANVFDSSNSGIIQSIRVKCKSVQTASLKMYFLTATASGGTLTDKTAPSIAAADITNLLGPFALGAADSGLGTETTWVLDGVGAAVVSASTSLFGLLVVTGTPTFASTSDIIVEITTLKD